ncbi:hypothetical protein K435DRAFT_780378 [Dendrothele bispora CBS 962.96]|uniref:Uncharacterized protein n=1 Tax=Dendrothele bispora (strain CBS 962.96) TaxID=1314807 RepID=A0A4V4HER1_DENBC|nr:hypothetical protein K435DRAFT_780378 [Dendrothele bispora CBS 962.96]
MDKLLVFSVHPASAKRQLTNHLQVPKPQILFFTYPVAEDVLRVISPNPNPISEIYIAVTTRAIMSTRPGYEEVYTLFKVAQSQILS